MEVELNQKYTRQLPVALHDKQIAQKGLELAHHLAQRDQIEGEMKQKVDEFKARIKQEDVVINAIRRQMDTGEELREVECMDIPNKETGQIETHRLDIRRRDDPRRIVTSRPMNLFESASTTDEDAEDGKALADAERQLKKERKSKARVIKAKPQKVEPEEKAPAKSRRSRKPKGGDDPAALSLVNGKDHSAEPEDEEEPPMIAGGEFEAGSDARDDYSIM